MIFQYPIALFICGLFLIGLLLEAFHQLSRPWSIPAIAVYLTTFGWYFVDPFQSPEAYESISPGTFTLSYIEVALFLATFRYAIPGFTKKFSRKLNTVELSAKSPTAEKLFWWLAALWVPLVLVGIWRMDGDVIAALFPFEGRLGTNMWGRGALGGQLDSLVSAAAYIYQLVCGLLGVTLALQYTSNARLLNAALWLLCIPYFLLSGNRSIFVAVIAPFFLTYLLMGLQAFKTRALIVGLAGIGIHFILLLVIENRNTGFRFLVDEDLRQAKEADAAAEAFSNSATIGDATVRSRRQEGLNMIQELCYINDFSDSGIYSPEYGMRYLTELTTVVPRVLWPGKPMLGIDYAIWRGFGSGEKGLGVFATLSTGMIGGGVLNFGKWAGPLAAGLLLATWAALLSRWWLQRQSLLRLCLFMAGLGLTFNLGRDITLLVLWPVVFGYIFVQLIEKNSRAKSSLGGGRAEAQKRRWNSVGGASSNRPANIAAKQA